MKRAFFLLGAVLATITPSVAATLSADDYTAIGLVSTLGGGEKETTIGNSGALVTDSTEILTGKYYLTASTYGSASTLYAPAAEVSKVNTGWIDNNLNGYTYSWLTISTDSDSTVDRLTEQNASTASGYNSFTVELTFDLTDYENIYFNVNLTYDDLISVYLNDTLVYTGTSGAYASFSKAFTVDSTYSTLLTATTNTFTFVVTNSSGKTTSATGFAVSFTDLAEVPEPATYGMLFGIGAFSLVLWQRRRRKAA